MNKGVLKIDKKPVCFNDKRIYEEIILKVESSYSNIKKIKSKLK